MSNTTTPLVLPDVLTVEQFARAMQLSPATVRRLHSAGRLPVQPLRIGRRLLFSTQAIQSFLSSNQQTNQN